MPDSIKYPIFGGILRLDTFGDLPTDPSDGTVALVLDTNVLYQWDEPTQTWTIIGSGSSVVEATINATVATTGVLPGSPTYANGASGVGATLTRTGNGAIGSIDSVAVAVSDRILVKNQVTQLQNGIYIVTDVGSAGTPYILTRTSDSDETAEFDDQIVGIAQGTTNAGTLWGQQTNNPTVGTDNIVYAVSTLGGVKQQTSGTQVLGQIPWWVTNNKTLSKGNQDLTWIDSTKTFTIKDSGNTTFLVDPANQIYKLGAPTGFGNAGTHLDADDGNNLFGFYIGSFGADPGLIMQMGLAGTIYLPYGSGTGQTHFLRFLELAANGGDGIGWKGPDARTSNTTLDLVMPPNDPTAGQVMVFSVPSAGVSTGSWVTPLSSGTAWLLDGNTVGSEKYIGTDDNFRFPVRVNNVETWSFETDGSIKRYGVVWSRETAAAGLELTTWGYNAGGSVASSVSQSVMVGYGAGASLVGGNGFTAVGASALILATVASNTAVGGGSGILHTTGNDCAYLGFRSGEDNVTGDFVTAIGSHAYSGGSGFSSILSLSSDGGTANNQIIIGGARNYNTTGESSFTDMYIGRGVTHATPGAITIHATSGLGTDIAGANLNFAIGQGTGTGIPGNYIFYKATASGSTGSSLNALSETFTIDGNNGQINRDGGLYSVPGSTTTTTWGALAGAASNNANTSSVFIGYGAGVSSTASGAIIINGDTNNFSFASTYGNATIAIGNAALASSTAGFNTAIGVAAGQFTTTGTGNVYLGYNADANPTFGNSTGSNNFVFGQYGFVGGNFDSVFSAQGLPSASNQIVFGGGNAAAFYSAGYFGNGVVNSTPQNFVFNGTGGSGTNKAGANVTIAGGKGTGSGAPGKFIISTSTADSTGSTLQTLADRATWDQTNVSLSPHGTSAGNTYEVRYLELAANGTNYFATKAADNIATTRTMVWPNDDPAAGEVLKCTSFAANLITTEWAAGGAGSLAIGDTITSATAGSIFFAGTAGILAQDNADLFWDATNNRLSINAGTSPVGHLHITADAAGGAQAFNIDGTVTTASTTYQVARWNTTLDASGAVTNFYVNNLDANIGGASANAVTNVQAYRGSISATGTYTGAITTATCFQAQNVTAASAGATITTGIGFNCDNFSNAGVTTKIAYRGQMNSGTNKFNLYMDGTADNHLEGNLLISTLTLTTGVPNGWNATSPRVIEVQSSANSSDSGIFLNRADSTRGLFLWNDNSTGDSYIENMYDNDAGDIIFRTKGLNATPIVPLTLTGPGKATFRASTTTAATINVPAGTAPTSPVEGDLWADSTQKAVIKFTDGIKQAMTGVIFTQTADKSVTNTTTETSIVGTGVGGLTLPTNFFVAGKTIRVKISGVYSTVAVTGDTVTIRIKYGSTTIVSKATTALVTGGTNLAWEAEAMITCRTTGGTGTVQVGGGITYQIAGAVAVYDEFNNGAATTTLDTTASALIDVTVQHSAADASNTVKSLVSSFEVLN